MPDVHMCFSLKIEKKVSHSIILPRKHFCTKTKMQLHIMFGVLHCDKVIVQLLHKMCPVTLLLCSLSSPYTLTRKVYLRFFHKSFSLRNYSSLLILNVVAPLTIGVSGSSVPNWAYVYTQVWCILSWSSCCQSQVMSTSLLNYHFALDIVLHGYCMIVLNIKVN